MNKDPNLRQMLREEVARILRATSAPTVRNQTAGMGGTASTVPPADVDGAATYATIKALLVEGENVTLTADDAAFTITIAATGGGADAVTKRRSWMGL